VRNLGATFIVEMARFQVPRFTYPRDTVAWIFMDTFGCEVQEEFLDRSEEVLVVSRPETARVATVHVEPHEVFLFSLQRLAVAMGSDEGELIAALDKAVAY
jgi:hypothetical protein